MKSFIVFCLLLIVFCTKIFSQNLVKNPSFENYTFPTGDTTLYDLDISYIFDSILSSNATVNDWIMLSQTPDAYSTKCNLNGASSLPFGVRCKYIYPHSGYNCTGGGQYWNSALNEHELLEGRLSKSMFNGHKYAFSIWVHLFDTIPSNWGGFGEIAGINSFDVLFSDTLIPSATTSASGNLPIQNYTPQVQINTMVTDTQHWVQLVDTFTYEGNGASYICIGNFKPDGQFQTQLVDSIRSGGPAAYYFYDDVSLIDLDSGKVSGITELGMKNEELKIAPNPTKDKLTVSGYQLSENTKVEVLDLLGRKQLANEQMSRLANEIQIDVSGLVSGIYFIKATDEKGFVRTGKFVKE